MKIELGGGDNKTFKKMAQQVPRAVQEKIKKLSQHVKLTLEYLKQFSTTQMPYYNFYYEFKHTANL